MGAVAPEKVAKLLRSMRRSEIPARQEKRAGHKASIEAKGASVVCWLGDHLACTIAAPSGPAARAIAAALRELQERRGSIF